MYKLLIATSEPEILEGFTTVPSYESYGFRRPVIAANAEEAVELLDQKHFDGIAYEFGSEGNEKVAACLRERHKLLPIIDANKDKFDIAVSLKDLGNLLGRLHADFSNDFVSEADMLQICRHNFVRKLLNGEVIGEETVRRTLRMLRSMIDPKRPCIVVTLKMPENNDFLAGRWHYGPERLEMALRNFFGAEFNGMRIVVSVLPDQSIRVLCGPMHRREVATDSMTGLMMDHLQESMLYANEFLGVELSITGVDVLPSVLSLAK